MVFKMKHRRIPPNMVDEVRLHLEQILSCGFYHNSIEITMGITSHFSEEERLKTKNVC